MSYKVPIVTTDVDFAREVCGDCALYFRQGDLNEVCEKILLVDSHRNVMRDNCQKQIEKVSGTWSDSASTLIVEMEKFQQNDSLPT